MLVKTKVIILFVLSLLGTAVMGFILLENTRTVQDETTKLRITSEIQKNIFEQTTMRDEYLLYREERPIVQLKIVSQALDQLFVQSAGIFTSTDERTSLKHLHDNSTFIDDALSQIVANYSDQYVSSSTDLTSAQQLNVKELEQRLISQILVKSQEDIAVSAQLSDASRNKVVDSQQRTIFLVLVSILGLILISVMFPYFIWRSIAKPLITLKEAIVRAASLDFSTTTSTTTAITTTRGEIGELGRAFEHMVTKLKESFESLGAAKIAARNVLEDLEAEKEKLAASNAKDGALLGSIGDGVIATDDRGLIMLINTAAEKLLGVKQEEVTGKVLSETIPIEDAKGLPILPGERPMSIALTTGTTTTETGPIYFYARKDKTRFPVSMTVTPVMLGGKVIGAIEVFRDITKEQEIDHAKSEFVSLASHQLRTPLTAVSWYTEMILEGDAGAVNPEQKKYLDEIYIGNQRMIELVNVLLDVSRLELGTLKVELKTTDIRALAQSVLDEQKSESEKKKLVIIQNINKDAPPFLTDVKLLRVVFQNLLSNSINYTPEGGTVTIEVALSDAKSILIKISDTGYGVPKSQQEKIFTKFFRADNVRNKDKGGTGLGLYIVKLIVEKFGGKIWFESPYFVETSKGKEEVQGTTFYVTLPLEGMGKSTVGGSASGGKERGKALG